MEGMRGHMQVSARRLEAPMAEQELDPAEIHPRFEEMCRKGVTKHMRMDHLREVRRPPGLPADQIHGLGRFLKKNIPHYNAEAGRIRISHLGSSGWRSKRL